MQTEAIQLRLNAIPARMSAKGLREPEVRFTLSANVAPCVTLSWKKNQEKHSYDRTYEYPKAKTDAAMLDAADAFITALPSAEETKTKAFLTSLAAVIELGRENGIEVAYVNPLVETMKRLSSNIITDQRKAA